MFNTDPRVGKRNMLFKHHCSRIKIKNFSLERIKDCPNAVHFYTGFENYVHQLHCLSVWSQKLVGCIFGKVQTNAKMEQ